MDKNCNPNNPTYPVGTFCLNYVKITSALPISSRGLTQLPLVDSQKALIMEGIRFKLKFANN